MTSAIGKKDGGDIMIMCLMVIGFLYKNINKTHTILIPLIHYNTFFPLRQILPTILIKFFAPLFLRRFAWKKGCLWMFVKSRNCLKDKFFLVLIKD